jgi:hypothetical protein
MQHDGDDCADGAPALLTMATMPMMVMNMGVVDEDSYEQPVVVCNKLQPSLAKRVVRFRKGTIMAMQGYLMGTGDSEAPSYPSNAP